MKLFCLISSELAHQTVFQFFGSLIGYMSPLALRVILAHVGPAGSKNGGTGGAIHLFYIQNKLDLLINYFLEFNFCFCIHSI